MIDYPLLLKPVPVPKVWAGNKLSSLRPGTPAGTGESWDISTVDTAPDDDSLSTVTVIANGKYAGKPLSEFLHLPVVVKLIDSGDRLSVQNHPDEPDLHKNEMWYIAESDSGAFLYYDINVSKEEFAARLRKGGEAEILAAMNRYDEPQPGDYFNVPTGTVHALGPGLLTYEISEYQQVTYRLYDYGRARSRGHLDIGAGIRALTADTPKQPVIEPDIEIDGGAETITRFHSFVTLRTTDNAAINRCGNYCLVSALKGGCEILFGGETTKVPYLSTTLLPPTDKPVEIKGGTVLISPLNM